MRNILFLFLLFALVVPQRVLAEVPPTCINVNLEAAQNKLVDDVGISLEELQGLIEQLPLQRQKKLRRSYLKRNLNIRTSLVDSLSNLPGKFTLCLLQPASGQCSVVLLANEKEALSVNLDRLLELYREITRSFGATLPSRLRASLKRYGREIRDLIDGGEEIIEALPDQVFDCIGS